MALATRLRCVSMTALGDAVVPPVGASTATSLAGSTVGDCVSGSDSKQRLEAVLVGVVGDHR